MKIIALAVRAGHEEVFFFSPLCVDFVLQFHLHKTWWCPPGYVDIGLIPEGARDIHIEEVAEAGNFLALRSDNPNKYFLNGGWTIQWNGEYKAAGTVFTYVRTGHLENLTSPGPTMEPLWVQVWLNGLTFNALMSFSPYVQREIKVNSYERLNHMETKWPKKQQNEPMGNLMYARDVSGLFSLWFQFWFLNPQSPSSEPSTVYPYSPNPRVYQGDCQ